MTDLIDSTLSPNTTYFSCKVDDKIRIYRPVGYKGIGFTTTLDNKIYRQGFEILYPNLGEFTDDSGDDAETWVVYHHKRSGIQKIKFVSLELGTYEFYFVLQGVIVHDHASVYMGGPAFATYYTEPQKDQEQ